MRKQSGYYDIDIFPALIVFCILSAVIGFGLSNLLEWLWPMFKAWLHQITG